MKNKFTKMLAVVSISTMLTYGFWTTGLAATGSTTVHTVVSGDTLWKISVQYGVTVQDVMSLNNLNSTMIMIGQQLKIPVKAPSNTISYTVKSGDVLWKIAQTYNVNINDIINLNHLDPNQYLYVGQILYIPGSTAQQPPAANTQPYVTYSDYIVQKGDYAWNLSIKFGIPMTELLQVNHLTEQSALSIGQKLKIPVHHVPVTATHGAKYGEDLDWWTQAQYVFTMGTKAKVTDFASGKSFNVIRSFGANHADCEPLTAQDAAIMYQIWGNQWSWVPRAAIVEVNGRKIAASVTNMPHSDMENIMDNNFTGHFDIHFLNSTTHVDGEINPDHQAQIKIAAGVK